MCLQAVRSAVMLFAALLAQGTLSMAQDVLDVRDMTDDVSYGYLDTCRLSDDIEVIVVHSNYHLGRDQYSTSGCMDQFRKYDVAPHYLIERNGSVIRMVGEEDVAYHAGPGRIASSPGRYRSINRQSIGIELINTRKSAPTERQYESLLALVRDICLRNDIHYVMRHSDIAPGRKTDPWMLDWERLARDVGRDFPHVIFGGMSQSKNL